jgi:signal transduction histidine kinase
LYFMADMARSSRTAGVDAFFRAQLAQRRDTMLRLSDEIGTAVAQERISREAELANMYAQFRRTQIAGVALFLILGLIVAAVTARRLLRLERDARALSAQLVQAQEQERRAIARELHDEVGQSLTGLLLDVGAAAASAESGAVRSRLETVASTARRLVEEVRRIALSLRPSMLDDLGLVPALEWQAREVGTRSGLAIEIDADDSAGQLPEAHRTCVYRIAQEALQNCVRHAGARRVRIACGETLRSLACEWRMTARASLSRDGGGSASWEWRSECFSSAAVSACSPNPDAEPQSPRNCPYEPHARTACRRSCNRAQRIAAAARARGRFRRRGGGDGRTRSG